MEEEKSLGVSEADVGTDCSLSVSLETNSCNSCVGGKR